MNELQEKINKFGGWENYYQYLLNTYGETKEQKKEFVKRTHTPEIQTYRGRLGGLANNSEQQSIKGRLGGLANTSEQQVIKGKVGGKNNTVEKQSIKGKANTSEQQRNKALKSAKVRYENSNEQLKPWEALGISRRTYYYRKKKDLI